MNPTHHTRLPRYVRGHRGVITHVRVVDGGMQRGDKVRFCAGGTERIVTEVNRGGRFWPAEEYHQRYFEKNGAGFCHVK